MISGAYLGRVGGGGGGGGHKLNKHYHEHHFEKYKVKKQFVYINGDLK